METLQVGYHPISSTTGIAHHKYILYTNKVGEIFRIDGGGTEQPDGSPFDDYLGNLLGFGELGHLSVKVTQVEPGSLLSEMMVGQPIETIHQGDDLSELYSKMLHFGDDITDRKETYHMFGNNSNGAVDEILERSDLPGTKLHEDYWSPGGGSSFVDWRATENNLSEVYGDNPEIYRGILQELAIAKSLGSVYADEFITKYGSLIKYDYDNCFLAGTMISMWPLDVQPDTNGNYDEKEVLAKVWKKPIEDITPSDWVLSFDKENKLKPGKVTRTFQNEAKIILDFHGTFVTPGHVYYREDSKKANKFEPLIDILRADGIIRHQDGTLIRATTGCEVGSKDDEQFWAFTVDQVDGGEVARANGVKFGRKPKLTEHQQELARGRLLNGDTCRKIAKDLGVSHTTISRMN